MSVPGKASIWTAGGGPSLVPAIGAGAGAVIGGAVGSVIPGPGTMAGVAVGAVVGGACGEVLSWFAG